MKTDTHNQSMMFELLISDYNQLMSEYLGKVYKLTIGIGKELCNVIKLIKF